MGVFDWLTRRGPSEPAAVPPVDLKAALFDADPDTRGELLVKKGMALATLGRDSEAQEILRHVADEAAVSISASAKAKIVLVAKSTCGRNRSPTQSAPDLEADE